MVKKYKTDYPKEYADFLNLMKQRRAEMKDGILSAESPPDTEKIKPKLVTILSDMIYNLTGEDISDLIDKKDRAGMSILNMPSSDNAPIDTVKQVEEKNIGFEDSINDVLGI
jgi:hypothetical protein